MSRPFVIIQELIAAFADYLGLGFSSNSIPIVVAYIIFLHSLPSFLLIIYWPSIPYQELKQSYQELKQRSSHRGAVVSESD